MSENMAREHAQAMARVIWDNTKAGAPFGWECSDCGEWFEASDPEHTDCGEVREASPMAYLADVLDIDYIVSSTGEYRGAEVLVGFGGPNVWIDTRAHDLCVAWWSATVREPLPIDFIDGLDEALEELWSMR